jgi:hypothetical protein
LEARDYISKLEADRSASVLQSASIRLYKPPSYFDILPSLVKFFTTKPRLQGRYCLLPIYHSRKGLDENDHPIVYIP